MDKNETFDGIFNIRLICIAIMVMQWRIQIFSLGIWKYIDILMLLLILRASIQIQSLSSWFGTLRSAAVMDMILVSISELWLMTPYNENESIGIMTTLFITLLEFSMLFFFIKGCKEICPDEKDTSALAAYGKRSMRGAAIPIMIVYINAVIELSDKAAILATIICFVSYLYYLHCSTKSLKILKRHQYIVRGRRRIGHLKAAGIVTAELVLFLSAGYGIISYYNDPPVILAQRNEKKDTEKAEKIRESLIKAGMEKKVASDLRDDEVLRYEGVEAVYKGKKQKKIDGAKLTMYSYLCRLPKEDYWRMLVYYRWDGGPKNCYTDLIQFDKSKDFFYDDYYQSVDGICMYDRDGKTVEYEFYDKWQEDKKASLECGEEKILTVRLPKGGCNYRGYYAVEGYLSGEIDTTFQLSNYYHRVEWANVPYKKPSEYFENGFDYNYLNFYNLFEIK